MSQTSGIDLPRAGADAASGGSVTAGLYAVGLRKSYRQREVVCDVGLTVGPGEIVGLLGPSGSGKSSIFQMLTGVERADHGSVWLDGVDVSRLSLDGRARLGIGYVPQAPMLFPGLSAEDNLRIAAEARNADRTTCERVLQLVIDWFAIGPVRKTRLGLLSGGQRKLIEIAFAICALPRFLLLDEPFAGLDPIVVETISSRIRSVAAMGVGVLLTDHKARAALSLVGRVNVIDSGMIISSGRPADVVRNARVRAVFLGESFRPDGFETREPPLAHAAHAA